VLITHDLGLVAGLADRIAGMYGGRVVEQGPADRLLAAPAHPYTAALSRSVPHANAAFGVPLVAIDGQPPRPGETLPGCAFEPRCPVRIGRCSVDRPELRASGLQAAAGLSPGVASPTVPLLAVEGLSVDYLRSGSSPRARAATALSMA
jgi:oligopeptide/dipeptide ABC transporter ATP-binding protein